MLIRRKVRADTFILLVRSFDVFTNVCSTVIFAHGSIYFELAIGVASSDVTYHILVGAVTARKSIYIEDLAFKIKATENKLLVQYTLNIKLF